MMTPNTRTRLGGLMHARTITTLLLCATALTACTTSDPAPAPDKPAATTAAPTLDQAQLTQQCVDAVAELPVDANGSVPSEPVPAECTALSDSDYLDAYMDGINQANQDALNAR